MKCGRWLTAIILLVFLASCAGSTRRDTLTMPYEDRLKLGSIYLQRGDEDRAIPVLEDAVAQEEKRPEAWAMLGELYWLKGDMEKSSEHLEKALEVGGDDPMVLNNLAWVESSRGNDNRSLGLVDRAILMDPSPLYPYLETRARILLKLERHHEALIEARAALSLTPEYDREMRSALQALIKEIEVEADGSRGTDY